MSAQLDFSTDSAMESRAYGTAITVIAGIRAFISKSVFQGSVEVPPIIAKVSIMAAGARAVKKADWIVFDPFLRE